MKILAAGSDRGDTCQEDVVICPSIPQKNKSSLFRLLSGLSFGVSSVFAARKLGPADVVITTSPPPLISVFGWVIAKMKRAKLIYDVRDIWPDVAWEIGSFGKESLYSKIFAFIRDFMLKHADLVTTVSPGKVSKLRDYHPTAEILHIANGFDRRFLENVEQEEIVERYHLDESFNCVYIGNLGLAQGLTRLLRAAKRAKRNGLPVRFIFFGRGVEEEKLKERAEKERLDNVVFAGYLPNACMYTILKHAGFSFVSLANGNLKDSVPTKMFEALGVGCPVLLSAAGDAADILQECGLGVAVDPDDQDALWQGLLEMYQTAPKILERRELTEKLMLTKYSRQTAAALLEKEIRVRFEHGESPLSI